MLWIFIKKLFVGYYYSAQKGWFGADVWPTTCIWVPMPATLFLTGLLIDYCYAIDAINKAVDFETLFWILSIFFMSFFFSITFFNKRFEKIIKEEASGKPPSLFWQWISLPLTIAALCSS